MSNRIHGVLCRCAECKDHDAKNVADYLYDDAAMRGKFAEVIRSMTLEGRSKEALRELMTSRDDGDESDERHEAHC